MGSVAAGSFEGDSETICDFFGGAALADEFENSNFPGRKCFHFPVSLKALHFRSSGTIPLRMNSLKRCNAREFAISASPWVARKLAPFTAMASPDGAAGT